MTMNIGTRTVADALDLIKSIKPTETAAMISRTMHDLPGSVLVAAPDDAHQAMGIVEVLLRTGTLDLIVVDAALCGGPEFARVLAQAAKYTTWIVLTY